MFTRYKVCKVDEDMNIKRIKVSLQHKYPEKEVEIEVSP